jgi:hypothetical protein
MAVQVLADPSQIPLIGSQCSLQLTGFGSVGAFPGFRLDVAGINPARKTMILTRVMRISRSRDSSHEDASAIAGHVSRLAGAADAHEFGIGVFRDACASVS